MVNSDSTLEQIERDIAERLAPVCAGMSPEAFRELVRDIARVKLKYGPESLASEQLRGHIGDLTEMAGHTETRGQSGETPL